MERFAIPSTPLLLALSLAVTVACKDKSSPSLAGDGDEPATAPALVVVPPIDIEPLGFGVAGPQAFNYPWGPGEKLYDQAAQAYRRKDWPAVKRFASGTVQADPSHLDAHRILATALAQEGAHALAIQHLRLALAGDFIRWGGRVLDDPELAPLLASPLGPKVQEMIEAHRQAFIDVARSAIVVVARRSAFKQPRSNRKRLRMGNRAEVFGYHRESKRYIRLTHTGFQVVGALADADHERIAFATITRINNAPADGSVRLDLARVGVITIAQLPDRPTPVDIRNVGAVAIEFREGGTLVAAGLEAAPGEEALAAGARVIDPLTGESVAAQAGLPIGDRLVVDYDGARLQRLADPAGVAADWDPETRTTAEFVIDASNQRLSAPDGRPIHRDSLLWSRDNRWLAFSTALDPCDPSQENTVSTVFLAEAETGRTVSVGPPATRMAGRFVGPTLFAYDNADGISLVSGEAGQPAEQLTNAAGLSLVGLGAARSPCPGSSDEELGSSAP